MLRSWEISFQEPSEDEILKKNRFFSRNHLWEFQKIIKNNFKMPSKSSKDKLNQDGKKSFQLSASAM